MGLWDTFIRVWQIRTSVRIQKGIENYIHEQKQLNDLNANIPSILNELEKKNESWENQMNKLKNID